jgi:hypothetical protein
MDMTTSPGVGLETLFSLSEPAQSFTKIPFHYLNIIVWLLLLLLFPLVFNNMLVSINRSRIGEHECVSIMESTGGASEKA